ncbi:MAG: hypothetical protein V7K89_17390 [Nostoc sp.]|uniref:hypothetical protein n=1 Tax=Nostoc sp. TaxID=1180 RepID=UPI002FFBE0AC
MCIRNFKAPIYTCFPRIAIALSISPSHAINSIWARVILLALLLPVLISDAYSRLRLRCFSTSSLLKLTVYFFAMMLPAATLAIAYQKSVSPSIVDLPDY